MGTKLGCDGETCLEVVDLSDGVCDEGFRCADFDWDEGDCEPLCADDEVLSCDETQCIPASWLDDDDCQA